ncbi:hypothetical protein ACFVJS_23390 [Nocardioides sp. NPDC057772]|uniref:hypothetical protein n=1 Tax=Nocardioides sp. NPDC057772 TaxID=3346245 RepID=UPI00367002F5
MDTEVTLDQQSAASSTTARLADEFSGRNDAAAIQQILHDSLDAQAKSSNAITDAPSLVERFAGIVYFSEMAADNQRDRRSSHRRTTGVVSGAEPPRSTRGRRTPSRPWRLPASERSSKS